MSTGIQESNTTIRVYVFIVVSLLLQLTASQKYESLSFNVPKYGTHFSAVLYSIHPQKLIELKPRLISELDRLELIFSTYLKKSELNSLISCQSNVPFKISDELFECLNIAQKIYQKSHKTFNPAVSKWSEQWKKARGHLHMNIIAETTLPNFETILLNSNHKTLEYKESVFPLDLGGIAKGYVLDQLAIYLKQQNIDRFLLALGGEILVGEAPPNQNHWTITCEGPDRKKKTSLKLVLRALSSSGASYQFIWREGQKFSHLYDPINKQASANLNIAYVIAETSAKADAWATVLSLRGRDAFKLWGNEVEWGGLLSNQTWVSMSGELP